MYGTVVDYNNINDIVTSGVKAILKSILNMPLSQLASNDHNVYVNININECIFEKKLCFYVIAMNPTYSNETMIQL